MNDLGAAIRGYRERVRPQDVGLPVGLRRRAPGLRREELGQLAGISVDYVVRLEQGRAESPSYQVVSSIARALRLTEDEREHLHRLAGQIVPGPDRVPTHVPASVQRLVDQLDGTPVAVFDAARNLLTWNALWAALMGDPTERAERNLARGHFLLHEPSRTRHDERQLDAYERSMAADLHRSLARFPNDPDLRRLIDDLLTDARFAEIWGSGDVERHDLSGKVVDHPAVGPIQISCDVLTVAGTELMIVAYTVAPGSEDQERLRLLGVLGTQELV